MLKTIGLCRKVEQIPEQLLISHSYGHLFFNLRYIYRLQKAVIGINREAIDLGLCGRVLDATQVDDYKKHNVFKRISGAIKYGSYMLSHDKALKRVKKVVDLCQIDGDTPLSLYNSINDNLRYLNDVLSNHYITSTYSGAMSSALYQVLIAGVKDEALVKSYVAGVLFNIEGIESVDILQSLKRLAQAIALDKDVTGYSTAELRTYLQTAPSNVKDLYDAFLKRHGHRAIKESELRNPGWKDNEDRTLEYIKTVIKSEKNAKEITSSLLTLQTNMEDLLGKSTGIKRGALKMLIKRARDGCRDRELSKSKMILVVDKFKIAYKKLALMLHEQGALPTTDLIYFLTQAELGELITSRNSKLIKKAIIRQRIFKEQETLKFEHVTVGAPTPIEENYAHLAQGEKLQGTPLSRGKIKGYARVVRSLEDAEKLVEGEIMVSNCTDIGWSPYYNLLGGLITEVGSSLSHGAVVAREYALPLVSNINSATDRIKDGDLLFLDGDKGTVQILEN
jgi:pyruvate,water dikinase